MKANRIVIKSSAVLALSLATTAMSIAQVPPGQPGAPGGRAFGGPTGGGMMFQRPGIRLGTPPLAFIPVAVLTHELKLTEEQVERILHVESVDLPHSPGGRGQFQGGGPGGFGGPGGPGGFGGPGGPGGFGGPGGPKMPPPGGTRRMQGRIQRADHDVTAVLTKGQRALLPDMRRKLGALLIAGVPLRTLAQLGLTNAQGARIVEASKNVFSVSHVRPPSREAIADLRKKITSILTDVQLGKIERWKRNHPRPFGPGGFGGPMGPPLGGGLPMPPLSNR